MFDTRPKSRTNTFIGLGLSAVIGVTVEAGAWAWERADRSVGQSIAGHLMVLSDHIHSGNTWSNSITLLPQGPWSGK